MIVQKSITVLNSLLKRVPAEKKSYYLTFYEDLLQKAFTDNFSTGKTPKDLSLKELFDKIDESWYIEKISTFSKSDLLFFTSLLSHQKRAHLREKLGIEGLFYTFSEKFELYCLNLFFKELFPNELPLPFSFLEETPLYFLTTGNTEKIHKLAFYLGLFDISLELKTVLKGSILKQLQITLFADEIAFCKEISEFRHPFSLGPLGLANWNENSDSLRKALFERGLYRLSIGLSNSSPDFIWYILHFLDKDIAKRLEKQPKVEIDTKIFEIALNQIEIAWKGVCTVLN
ncbi:MAG: hypothetical protein FJZ59_01435 [Chlamydiae bacterium]|nr:hypothetical protein [Chlamydiota bacterium]